MCAATAMTTSADIATFVGVPLSNSGSLVRSRKVTFCRPRFPSAIVRRRQRRRNVTPTFCLDPFTEEERLLERRTEAIKAQKLVEEELKQLEGTKLKWSEIDFPTIEDELNAIDEYVREEEIEEGDCWPIFLRACAYESRGQTQLALAHFSKIKNAAGLSMVPNLWERRGYNSFKAGAIKKADALFDVSAGILAEAVGNGLHFSHWFDDNFANFIPRHNGPAFSLQRGICKYCAGKFDAARSGLVPGLVVRDLGSEHGFLWLIATTIRTGKSSMLEADIDIIKEYYTNDIPNDLNGTLRQCMDFYFKVACDPKSDCETDIGSLRTIAEQGAEVDGLIAAMYLALFFDSVRRDESERDRWLDKVAEYPGGPSSVDTLDFVFHAAKSRFGATDTSLDMKDDE